MITLALDDKNNLTWGFDLATSGGLDAIVQDTRTRLSMLSGEYPYNIDEGVDYYGLLSQNNRNALLRVIKDEILKDNRIHNVEIEFVRAQGGAQIQITATTKDNDTFGEIIHV